MMPSTPPPAPPIMSRHPTTPLLIIHGGAGNTTRSNLPPTSWLLYQRSLSSFLRHTHALLTSGSTALAAATECVVRMEENPLFNCGKGAVFARNGTIELEASVMVSSGYRKRGVGVALVKRVRNPIKLAREMLLRGETDGDGGDNGGEGDPSGGAGGAQGHSFLSGHTVERLAEGWGLEMVHENWHWTRKRWEEHRRGLGRRDTDEEEEGVGFEGIREAKRRVAGREAMGLREGNWEDVDYLGDIGWDGKEYLPQGTVGCVCLDRYGTLCVATSTGGLTNKLPGRIGDTPTLGAGFWAEEWEVPAPRMLPLRTPRPTMSVLALLQAELENVLHTTIRSCTPASVGYSPMTTSTSTQSDEKRPDTITCGAAMSGTGNGDSFLRLDAVRTAAAIARFAPGRSLAAGVKQIAGPGGDLQMSAGERWGKTGEGEGGIIGIGIVDGKGEVVFDFNCGGMFRAYFDDQGRERVMVFREDY